MSKINGIHLSWQPYFTKLDIAIKTHEKLIKYSKFEFLICYVQRERNNFIISYLISKFANKTKILDTLFYR